MDERETLVLYAEDGTESEMEVLDHVEYEGEDYVVLYPVWDEKDGPVVIMRCENEEYYFLGEQDLIDAVYALYLKQQEGRED